MINNRAIERLRTGEAAIGTTVRIPCAETMDILSQHPFDFLLIDMQHGAFGLDTLRQMLLPLGNSEVAPIVRVPENAPTVIGQVLDLGAAGVVIPDVASKDDAIRAARAARYPPAGERGICFGLRPQNYGAKNGDAYITRANRNVLVGLMIESYAGVEHIEEIVKVPGIDVIYVGRFDLAYSMGLRFPAQQEDPSYVEANRRVETAVLRSSIVLGAGASDRAQAEARIRAGVRFLIMQSDQAMLNRAAADLAATLASARNLVRKA